MTEPLSPGAVQAVAESSLESVFVAKLRSEPAAAWAIASTYIRARLIEGVEFKDDTAYVASLIRKVGLPRLAELGTTCQATILAMMGPDVRKTLGL